MNFFHFSKLPCQPVSQHSSFIKAPVLTRRKTVTHSDRPVCSYVRQYFSQCLLFVKKKPLNRNLTKFFPATLLVGESLEPLIELQSPCSNTAASMGFYRTAPPWIQRYAQLLLCCPETECHFRNTPHSTNRIVLQEALQTAKTSKLDFPISVRALYTAPMHQFSEFTCHRMKRIT